MQDKALIYDYSDNRCFCILMAIVVCSLHVTEGSDVNATSIAIIYSSPRDIAFENSVDCTVQFINGVVLLNKSIELHANITHIERDLTGVSAFKTGLSLQENGGFVAVIGPMARRDIIVLQPHIAALNIPHIIPKSYSSSFEYESSAYPMLVRMDSNDFTDQINGILEVMLKMQWTSIGLLIQKDSFYQAVSRKFYFLAKSVNIEVTFFMEFDEINVGTANTKDQIQTITKSGQRFILLLTSERLVNSVLQQASSCGLNEPNWVWILWSDVFDTMKNMTNFGITSGIALRQQFTATSFSERLKKCEIPQNLIVRKYIDSLLALSYGLKSLLDDNGKVTLPSLGKYLSWEFGQNLFKHILSANHSNNGGVLNENIRFNVTTAKLMSETVFDVINLQNNTWVTVGNISEHSSGQSVLKLEHDRVMIGAKHNESYSCHMTLKNSKLRVATMHAPPFVMAHTYEAKYSGYAFDIFYKLQKDIGFSAEIFNIFSGAFGAKDPLSGDWNGLIGEIVEGRADIAVGPITLTNERQKVVDFTESFLKTNLKYIIDIQAAGGLMAGYDRYGFLRPFTWTLWLVIALCVLAVGVYFTLISHLSPYGAHGHYFQSDEAEAANIRMERRRSSVMTISGVSSSSLFRRRSSSISHNTQYKGNEEKGVGWKSNQKSRQIEKLHTCLVFENCCPNLTFCLALYHLAQLKLC